MELDNGANGLSRRIANGLHDALTNGHTSRPVMDPHNTENSSLLWRTVFRSPCIRSIFPGRIRSDEQNDLLLIGDFFVELREWKRDSETLQVMAVTNDFSSRIIAAQMLGERRSTRTVAVRARSTDLRAAQAPTLPRQILVLTLEDATLAFLAAQDESDGSVTFLVHASPLIPGASSLVQPGRHIATDPGARAIAVGAADDTLMLYRLRPSNDLDNPCAGMVSLKTRTQKLRSHAMTFQTVP